MRLTAIILLFLSWPVTLVHRLYNNSDAEVVDWYVYVSYPQDKQWYVYLLCVFISFALILSSMLLYITSKEKGKVSVYVRLLAALLVIQLIEIINYCLYYSQNDGLLFIQWVVLVGMTIKHLSIFSNGTKRKAKYHESIL